MSKFNIPSGSFDPHFEMRTDSIQNNEGGTAFTLPPEARLYQLACTCLVGEKKFYDKSGQDKALREAAAEVAKTNPMFLLQLASYCRTNMGLRSVPLMLALEYAKNAPGQVPGAAKYISTILQRADELTEILAMSMSQQGKVPRENIKYPMVIRNAVKLAFESERFDEYQLAKYKGDGKSVSLKYAMIVSRPKPHSPKQGELFEKIMGRYLTAPGGEVILVDGKPSKKHLAIPETWETQRSMGLMTWPEVLRNIFFKNGRARNYFAIIRNLNNMLSSIDMTPQDFDILAKAIMDQNAIANSRIWPFRYLAAISAIEKNMVASKFSIQGALANAFETSINNMPKLPGHTLFCGDVSGSMSGNISAMSNMDRRRIAILMATMGTRFCENPYLCLFANETALINLPRNTNPLIATGVIFNDYARTLGGGTQADKVFSEVTPKLPPLDRIVFFTDQEFWGNWVDNDRFQKLFWYYKNKVSRTAKLFLVNLESYGTSAMPYKFPDTHLLAGWTPEIFKYIAQADVSPLGVVDMIKKIDLEAIWREQGEVKRSAYRHATDSDSS